MGSKVNVISSSSTRPAYIPQRLIFIARKKWSVLQNICEELWLWIEGNNMQYYVLLGIKTASPPFFRCSCLYIYDLLREWRRTLQPTEDAVGHVIFRIILSVLWKPGFDPSSCEIFGRRSGLPLGQVLIPVLPFFSVDVITPMLTTPFIHSLIHPFIHSFCPWQCPYINIFPLYPRSSLTVGSFFAFSQIWGVNPRIKMYHLGPQWIGETKLFDNSNSSSSRNM